MNTPSDRKREISLLVVEDDPHYFYMIKRSLESSYRCRFQIDQAVRIDEAFQKLRKNEYHLILAEDKIADRQGIELLREMHEVKMDLPFVLMANVRDDSVARDAVKYGVSKLLIKSESEFHDLPFMIEESLDRYCEGHPTFGKFSKSSAVTTEKKGQRKNDKSVVVGANEEMIIEPAYRDEMTGVYSHSYFHERMAIEFASASRYDYAVSCLFIDVDNFRYLNEGHGFTVGDKVLKKCAQLLFEHCRMTDVIARYGGEEFAILLPHTGYKGATELAGRIQKLIGQHTFLPEEFQIHITLSIGIASFPEDYIEKRFEILSFAKQAAFRATLAGCNRIVRYKDMSLNEEDMPTLQISKDKVVTFQRRIMEISDHARKSCIDTSCTLVKALDEKDKVTASHSTNTARYARLVAEHMKLPLDEVEIIQHAALLHDVGKLCIPDELLSKNSKLSFQEYEAMKQHPYMGYKILKPIRFLQQEAILVLHHHEWFNGKGYPCELKGNEIPLGSRIIAVVDTFDTMLMAGKSYKETQSVLDAVNELIHYAGTQFDPHVVKNFIEVLKRHGELTSKNYNADQLSHRVQENPPKKAA